MMPHKPPTFHEEAFNCPHCKAYSHQLWFPNVSANNPPIGKRLISNLEISQCQHCEEYSVWLNEVMIHPEESGIEMPNPDLPDDIKADYDEARSIAAKSPRAAAALLRLCVQRLCQELGEPGKELNRDIASLVRKGLPVTIQKSLDIVRVVGNNAVHPGEMDLKDDVKITMALFKILNLIAEDRITRPKEIEQMYGTLPDSDRNAIEERDERP